ncbi:hypothetical protein FRC07_000493 [Ceratobasidium sp. 392]|nr:hypothetical protein FRC07_000493 [Ceratobasidium sp. 392]
MRLPLLLAAFPLLIAASDDPTPCNDRICWKPCYKKNGFKRNLNAACGKFDVPLDYANPSVGVASLAVALYPATNTDEPKLGTLFLGPGGPGQSGVDTLILDYDNANTIMNAVGGRYDLVSWDPRGSDYHKEDRTVTETSPRADCFNDATEEYDFWHDTVPRWGLEARGEFKRRKDIIAFHRQVGPVDRLLKTLGEKCNKKSDNKLKFMGTTATVRDLVALHDYLVGEDKDINFWGFSYGTAIGIYLVNMFNNRVGRVVLDGVVDPVYYANKPPHKTWFIDAESSEATLSGFLSECAKAGPDKCAFASAGSTAKSLRKKIINLVVRAYDYRAKKGKGTYFGSSHIRDALFKGMYTPKRWDGLAKGLESCWRSFEDKATTPNKGCRPLIRGPLPQSLNKAPAYSLQAVTCADAVNATNVKTEDVFNKMVEVTQNSGLSGGR